ncbi:N-acetylmuramoyl-L-alanine amidase [Miniphocaeibacter massiliensis]|uniref:N-acetylmuramoyl-L-alanine amidase n=1 Tax=Miniphocaeibacter massiliensis TaxID=2041841 RepID=UPI000C1BCAF5|nr:N-acetylmuramoyl-L-alanine amidase [Miniphocaeibacter massiliensis]
MTYTPPYNVWTDGKIKVLLDPGHGNDDRGYIDGLYKTEGESNLAFAKKLKSELEKYGIVVGMTRTTLKEDPSLAKRGQMGKGYDLLLSIHTNAFNGTANGTETYDDTNSKFSNKELATLINNTIVKVLGTKDRGVKYWKLSNGKNYFGVLRNNSAINGMLIEHAFHDNKSDVKKWESNQNKLASELAKSLASYYGLTVTTTPSPTTADINIIGKTSLTKYQMLTYCNSKNTAPKLNTNLDNLIDLYIKEGEVEGVDGAVAFVQAMHETGYFKFGGDVDWKQNNYAGIGATGNGAKGNTFSNPQIGVRAQIQHLKAYASTESLKQECVDPRFKYVTRGTSPTIFGLAGTWAADKDYGTKLLSIYNHTKAVETVDNQPIPEEERLKGRVFVTYDNTVDKVQADRMQAQLGYYPVDLNSPNDLVNADYIIHVGGGTSHSADITLTGVNRLETENKVTEFIKKQKGA